MPESIITEYRESGTKAWKVIYAPFWILHQIAKAAGGGLAIICRNGREPPHINIPLKREYRNDDY